MKKFLRQSIHRYLKFLAKTKIKRNYQEIIGITGTIGKSSTKQAITTILAKHFQIAQTYKNYNTDFGVMLSVLNQKSGKNSILKWGKSLIGSTYNFLFDHQKKASLILEMGIDKPGDMQDLLKIAKPTIGILTNITPVHMSKTGFQNLDQIFAEKSLLITQMDRGTAILNYDNDHIRQLEKQLIKADKLWFGTIDSNTNIKTLPRGIWALNPKTTTSGISATIINTITKNPTTHKCICPILGIHHFYILLPALITAFISNINLPQAIKDLQDFSLPPGRLNLIPGRKNSLIIDSSYNASPQTVISALETLWQLPSQRKIAVLGSMNELGSASSKSHQEIGKLIPKYTQMLITVGDEAKNYAQTANNNGLAKHLTHHFATATAAGKFLQKELRHDDLILVKGSQNNINLENCIKLIMKDPSQASQLLVRQT